MKTAPPPIDTRNATDITAQVKALIKAYAPAYTGLGDDDNGTLVPDAMGAALIGVFGRFTELIIQRLNRVPDKNFLAYLDLLGASQLPPQPARVPLTFSLAAGTLVPAVVPAGTQAAAAPAKGEKEPVIFETERELVATPATLTAVFVRDPELDIYADLNTLVTGASADGVAIFRGDRPLDHILYLAFDQLLALQGITSFQIAFALTSALTDPRQASWEAWNGAEWASVGITDATNSLRLSGTVDFGAISPVPVTDVRGVSSRWLRVRLRTLINQTNTVRRAMVRASQLPDVQSITGHAVVNRTNLSLDAAFTNQSAIDASKDFFPFGETPRFGDTFFFRIDEPLALDNAAISFKVEVTNPASTKPPVGTAPAPIAAIVPTTPSTDLVLSWEAWNGSTWTVLGTSTPTQPATGFPDGTKAFTQSGDITLPKLPSPLPQTTVNGVLGYWLRVRIVQGNYGHEARYVPDANQGFKLDPATFAPPIIRRIGVNYTLNQFAPPTSVLIYNDFTFADETNRSNSEGQSFPPFVPMADDRPTIYLGFELPPAIKTFPNVPMSFFARAADVRYGDRGVPIWPLQVTGAGNPGSNVTYTFTITNPDATQPASIDFTTLGTTWKPDPIVPGGLELDPGASGDATVTVTVPASQPLGTSDAGVVAVSLPADTTRGHLASFKTWAGPLPDEGEPVRLAWESWNGSAWTPLTVQDDAANFTTSGTVEFLAPPGFAPRGDFGGGDKYWIRVRWDKGDFALPPRLVRFLLNTTMAGQTVTVRNETLGSSEGSKSLRFKVTRAPILPGQRLEVREPELPSTAERSVIEREEGGDAIATVLDAQSRPKEIWVRWHQVPDFYASGPRDRHYVVDRLSGEIRFGDGLNGLVPPTGVGNVRMPSYQTGGGSTGNRPAGVIVQLKTTVPYVDKVTNHEPAAGGADAEPVGSLLDRVPRAVRHGGRAVTVEDYEDLARLATPEVARALCVPLANLAVDPLVQEPANPGDVSVIIVPISSAAKPLPSLELIRRVQDSLDRVHVSTATLSIVGPLYVRVDVTAEVALVSLEGATRVLADVQQKVVSFLHPLTGGIDGTGWDFGRRPHDSDFYALIEAVPGVDHIRALDVVEVEDMPGVTDTGRFLVYSGTPTISVIFEEA